MNATVPSASTVIWRSPGDATATTALAPAENCTFEVVRAGKLRFGTNAARHPHRATSPLVVQITNLDINHTIPTVGSKSEFRKGRYLYFTHGGDYYNSMNHYFWSFLCSLGEAKFLNWAFVMYLYECHARSYTSTGENEDGNDFGFYFDLEHLNNTSLVVEKGGFFGTEGKWDRSSSKC
ncbi:hypothetical protein MA16_Dca001316 [Dendrobium catenatum]|uniref:DUF7075 domain-containing protein n=1 Tax=Dendrobium catenatum TaxID=906689 RepID=A0A2I0WM29_9ASPA|nr:hypothetical protein MA16_Dca001316 [Dendrobium catenatum]